VSGARCLAFRVTGRVQGVWFRGWTRATAQGLGLTGWVRNEADGSVRGAISGPAEAVAAMVRALQEGPEAARVVSVETSEAASEGWTGFEVRR